MARVLEYGIGWDSMPAGPGVYLLYDGDEVIYAGATLNLRRRVKYHNLRGKFTRVKPVPCYVHDLRDLEAELLTLHKPRYNKRLVSTCSRRTPGCETFYWLFGERAKANPEHWFWSPSRKGWHILPKEHVAEFRRRGYCIASKRRPTSPILCFQKAS